ncbi:hypothetical protein [Streptomyces sp. NPDC001205]
MLLSPRALHVHPYWGRWRVRALPFAVPMEPAMPALRRLAQEHECARRNV